MKGFCLQVTGEFACFTRPEMKVERVSYDVITPSAARAIFEAILWKPAIKWRVTRIEVLAPIRWASVRRNEVGKVASPRGGGIFIEDDRQQRAGLILRDVKYRLSAEFDLVAPSSSRSYSADRSYSLPDDSDDGTPASAAKYAAMFERRARKGQCFNQPYLGCREFSCAFRLVDPVAEPATSPAELAGTRDLGWMLYDLNFADPKDIRSMFFRAEMNDGVITVPPRDSEEVRQ